MKASTPAKGLGKRASSGKAASKPGRPTPKAKTKAAAPAKQASATRRVPVPRPKLKAAAKPVAKRAVRPASGGARAASKAAAPSARRGPGGRVQSKPASAPKRPAAKPAAVAARKPAAKVPASAAKRSASAKAPRPQARREARPSGVVAKPPAAKAAAKVPAANKTVPAKPAAASLKPPAAPKPPVPAVAAPAVKPKLPAPAVAAAKLKPPPRSEAGSSAQAPVRVAAPLVTPAGPALHQAPSPGLAPAPVRAPARPVAPPMNAAGLARTLPDTHFVIRRDVPPIQPTQPSAMPVEFKSGDHVVYPTHGVGTVQGIETMSAAGYALQVIVVTFDENRMTLRVPIGKAMSSGLRKLASSESMTEALDTLRGRARVKRTMWSRRAQEYEAKINSGDPVQIAEVVRDLHRNAGQPDQSFSERQIYEQAMDRLAAELAAIDRTDKPAATEKLLNHLNAA